MNRALSLLCLASAAFLALHMLVPGAAWIVRGAPSSHERPVSP